MWNKGRGRRECEGEGRDVGRRLECYGRVSCLCYGRLCLETVRLLLAHVAQLLLSRQQANVLYGCLKNINICLQLRELMVAWNRINAVGFK
ncbi:hypothetical protein Zmor_022705 [Zophobas morio]|uniref:Uncharacterized protein n=1 Tax=Zophobas morio TaxID=2755281 RepID=A0AA38HZ22_9CUCU|nr:hypothetical protein Zmor_022705 [Zophobas morio]